MKNNRFSRLTLLAVFVLLPAFLFALNTGQAKAAYKQPVRQTQKHRLFRHKRHLSNYHFVQQRQKPQTNVNQTGLNQPAVGGYSINGIINAINAERQANGLAPVKENPVLDQAAAIKAKDMADQHYFAHTNPQGKSDFDFLAQVGYRYQAAGSNLAQGSFGGDKGLVSAWMNSPGHRANILASFGQEIGIGMNGDYFSMFITQPM